MIVIKNRERLIETPDVVFVDTDNTLYDYDVAHKLAMESLTRLAVKKLGLDQNEFGKLYEQAKKEIKENLNDVAASHSRLLYCQRSLELLGLGSQVVLAMEMEQTYWRSFLLQSKLFPGVKDFFDELRLRSIAVVNITDMTANIQFRKLVNFGLDHLIDTVVTSEEAGSDKPDPKPFLLAIQKLNKSARNIWMVGDNPVADIFGAKTTLGATTVQKIHAGIEVGKGQNEPDAYFSDFRDLTAHLKRLSS